MRVRFKGYVPERLPSGETRHRVRVEGNPKRRVTIPVGPDDPTFTEHYYAARAGKTVEARVVPSAVRHSVGELVRDYLMWVEDQVTAGAMNIKTLRQRQSLMRHALDVRDELGDRLRDLHADLPPEAFVLIRDSWGARTAQADNTLKAFSACYKWAMERGRAERNPVTGVRKVHISAGGAVPWSVNDLRAFLKVHGERTTARRWLMLALFTGARISDTVRHGRKHEVIRDGRVWLEWQPAKRGSAFTSVPVAPPLLTELRAARIEGATYLLSNHGRPYRSPESLRRMVQAWTLQAGLERRSQHGVRKALAELLAEAGCTTHQLMAVLAHTKPQTSAIYTENADRRRLAAAAMDGIAALQL